MFSANGGRRFETLDATEDLAEFFDKVHVRHMMDFCPDYVLQNRFFRSFTSIG